ncbi:MAG TPA: hydroxymethylglutaryl-CoA lyase [Thermomicrobiales bacterium]|nr:hydroxymethylglutaryl-CoA lyase [Thermomicrobiales bacterium]
MTGPYARQPDRVTIVEVGPRDGLQNHPATFATSAKVAFIEALAAAGAKVIETTSFVSPVAVPRLADADQLMHDLHRQAGVRYLALVPNERGYERAISAGIDSVALFASATEAFSQANLRASIDETFERFHVVARRAKTDAVWLRGYVSVAFACPYSGATDPDDTRRVAERLLNLGCDEIALADTIGAAEPAGVRELLDKVLISIPAELLALHVHDTGGRALANVDAALEYGIRTFDSSAGGLGGCPFAPGAPGNVATEILVEHLAGRGIETGIDPHAVRRAVVSLLAAGTEPVSPEA